MSRILLSILLVAVCAVSAFAQADTTGTVSPQAPDTSGAVAPPQTQPPVAAPQQTAPPAAVAAQPPQEGQPKPSRVYYGGTVGFSFGDYFRLSIYPWVGYKVTPKFSLGGKVGYEYIRDERYSDTLTSHNYGGSVFARQQVGYRFYAHGEFAYISYKYHVSEFESDRQWVPYLFLGGGYWQPMGRNTALMVEVLFDVLQNDNSPYEDWSPFVSVGVGVGF